MYSLFFSRYRELHVSGGFLFLIYVFQCVGMKFSEFPSYSFSNKVCGNILSFLLNTGRSFCFVFSSSLVHVGKLL